MSRFIPDSALENFNYYGEKVLAEKLLGLPDDFSVYHSIDWVPENSKIGQIEGESDFVVYHRELGILIIEVKGGEIEIINGIWYFSETREHDLTEIKSNPILQGKRFRHVLLPRLRKICSEQYFMIGYCSSFPTCIWNSAIPAGLTVNTLLDKKILDSAPIETVVRNAFKDWWGRTRMSPAPLSDEADSAVREVLGEKTSDFAFSKRLATIDGRLVKMTNEQRWLTELLPLIPRLFINGAAGTGKTIILTSFAKELLKANKSVLFLVFNKKLAAYLDRQIKHPVPYMNAKVFTWHQLTTSAGIKWQDTDNLQSEQLWEKIIEYFEKILFHPDAILIDEGHSKK